MFKKNLMIKIKPKHYTLKTVFYFNAIIAKLITIMIHNSFIKIFMNFF